MDLDSLVRTSGEWLRGTGPESDIVVSSRIRLARNLAEFPFPIRCDDSTRGEIVRRMRDKLADLDDTPLLHWFDVAAMNDLDRQSMVERQLVSREFRPAVAERSAHAPSGRPGARPGTMSPRAYGTGRSSCS